MPAPPRRIGADPTAPLAVATGRSGDHHAFSLLLALPALALLLPLLALPYIGHRRY